MGLALREARFIYTESDKEKVLLDCSDFLSNKSKIPLQAEGLNVLEFLIKLAEKERFCGAELVLPFLLIDILMASLLIRTARPFKVLEYGCDGGKLSYHLAELLGIFCEESSLVCVSDSLDMKWIEWKEKISQADHPPKISYMAGDYSNLPLQKKYFDIILINGISSCKASYKLLTNALQFMTDEGSLIYYADETLPLESTLRLFFKISETYVLSPTWKIFFAKAMDKCFNIDKKDPECHIQSHLHKAQSLLEKKDSEKKEILNMIAVLQQDIQYAITLENTRLKIQLLDIKSDLIEKALDYSAQTSSSFSLNSAKTFFSS